MILHAPRRVYLVSDRLKQRPARPLGSRDTRLRHATPRVLAQALVNAVRDRDGAALANYSATVLPRIWKYQEFSAWMTDTMHDAGDPAQHGVFRQMLARARLDAVFSSPAAARLHSDFQRGMA